MKIIKSKDGAVNSGKVLTILPMTITKSLVEEDLEFFARLEDAKTGNPWIDNVDISREELETRLVKYNAEYAENLYKQVMELAKTNGFMPFSDRPVPQATDEMKNFKKEISGINGSMSIDRLFII